MKNIVAFMIVFLLACYGSFHLIQDMLIGTGIGVCR